MRPVTLIAASAALLTAGATAVHAGDICRKHAKADWMSVDEITAKVSAMGYDIHEVEQDDGCWEIKGRKDGKLVEAYFDPVTAELVYTD